MHVLGRFIFEPGWRWSECIKPVVKTDACMNSHVGYAVSGRITVVAKDGTKIRLEPGRTWVELVPSYVDVTFAKH